MSLLLTSVQRPLVNYYGCVFILWELSTPFLNIHWFFDKVNMTGSRAQLYNGILLLFSFFSCRLIYGTFQSFCVMRDMWTAVNSHPTKVSIAESPVMEFATQESTVQAWLAISYVMSNLTLNSLNFYWFVMMIRAVLKRFKPNEKLAITEAEVDLSSIASGVSLGSGAQRRKQDKS